MRRFVISTALIVLFTLLMLHVHIRPAETFDKVQNAFGATCMIKNHRGGFGTGVLLDSGYILTAGHVVDANNNGSIDPVERRCTLRFGRGDILTASVLYFSDGNLDFAILELSNRPNNAPTMRAANRSEILGEPVFTVGATAGHSPHITHGYVSTPELGHARASCFVGGGNSGGAIVNDDGEHLGVVIAVGVKRTVDVARIPFPVEGNLHILTVRLPRTTEVNSLCLFVPIDEIRYELKSKLITHLIDKPQRALWLSVIYHPCAPLITITFLQLHLLFGFIFYVRKHLFS